MPKKSTNKAQFFALLNKASQQVFSVVKKKSTVCSSDDYSEKQTHQDNVVSASQKHNDKSHQ